MQQRLSYLILCLLLAAALLTGCGSACLSDGETQVVEIAEKGCTFLLPADWQQQETDAEHEYLQGVWHSHDGALTLQVFVEWGGMEYDSLEETASALANTLAAQLFPNDVQLKGETKNQISRYVLQGTDNAGNESVCCLYLSHPFMAGRYYLLFTMPKEEYKEQQRLIGDVMDSFTVTLTAEEVYPLIQAERDAALEAELQRLEMELQAGSDGQINE